VWTPSCSQFLSRLAAPPSEKQLIYKNTRLKVESNHPVISIVKGDAAGISVYARLAGLIFLVLLDLYLCNCICVTDDSDQAALGTGDIDLNLFMHCDFYHFFERIFHAI